MAILVPGPGFIAAGSGWKILPPPSGNPIGSSTPRQGENLNIYEIINPSVQIIAQGSLACPSSELINGISIARGSAPNLSGIGVSVLSGGVRNIPEMSMPVFSEPYVVYNRIQIAPGLPTLTLPAPLTGYISEKYLWDQEYAAGTYSTDTAKLNQDQIVGASYDRGIGIRKRPFPEKALVPRKDISAGSSLFLSTITPMAPGQAATSGSSAIETASKNSSYTISYRASFIRTLRFFYTITVTSTCPPYIFYFPAYMDVDNNWDNHAKRVTYRINRSKGPLPGTVK